MIPVHRASEDDALNCVARARAKTADFAESRIQATTLSVSASRPPSPSDLRLFPPSFLPSFAPSAKLDLWRFSLGFFGRGAAAATQFETLEVEGTIASGEMEWGLDAIILDISVCRADPRFEKPKCLCSLHAVVVQKAFSFSWHRKNCRLP